MLSIGLCVFLPEQAGLSASWLLTPAHLLVLAFAVLILIVSSCRMWLMFGSSPLPRPLADLLSALSPFPIANTYGLFSVMTKVRPEIVIEASCDGVQWSEYQFKFKPGQTARAPRLVAPHQPRLDWQMWFAALNPYYNIWFIRFVMLLLQGSPATRSLLARGSLSIGHPPKFVRALLYRYRFTTQQEKRATGMWWKRSLVREYLPPVSLSLNRYGIEQRAEDQVTAAGRTPVRATPES
jgi:hypothetical protein